MGMKALRGAEECCLDQRVDSCILLLGMKNGICTHTAVCKCLGLLGERILLCTGDRLSHNTVDCLKEVFFTQHQAAI